MCSEATFSCVECVADADCPDQGPGTAATNTCKLRGVIVEGGGILCTTSSTTNDNNVPFALLGLVVLGMTRRRCREFVLTKRGAAGSHVAIRGATAPTISIIEASGSDRPSIRGVFAREFAAAEHPRKNRRQSFLHVELDLSEDTTALNRLFLRDGGR